MPFVRAANTAQINLCYKMYGQQAQNVFHVLGTVPFTPTTLAQACVAFQGWWADKMAPLTSNHLTLDKIIARALDSQQAPAIEYVTAMPIEGDDVQEPLPANAAAVIKWVTGIPGRSFRGRTYVTGLTITHTEGNTFATAYQTALRAAATELLNVINATDFELVVVSKWSYGNARNDALCTPITGTYVDPNVDSQRRRLTGRGS